MFCTDLHTLGEVGQAGGIERARGERVIHVVLQAANRHTRSALDPRCVVGLRPGREHEVQENLAASGLENTNVEVR